jgi:hypothetical protein
VNPSTPAEALQAPEKDPPVPRTFLITVFGASILVGAAIMYFGVRGQLGWGIP